VHIPETKDLLYNKDLPVKTINYERRDKRTNHPGGTEGSIPLIAVLHEIPVLLWRGGLG
jgi:hypothetical protein